MVNAILPRQQFCGIKMESEKGGGKIMQPNDVGTARNRLAAMQSGGTVGIDELALLQIFDVVVESKPNLTAVNRFTSVDRTNYRITATMMLKGVLPKELKASVQLELTVEGLLSGVTENDVRAVRSTLVEKIEARCKEIRSKIKK